MSRTLSIRLDEETARFLEEEARRTNQSKGRIIREALLVRSHGSGNNAYEGLQKYAGLMEGPTDLSTNKKHFKGLGRPKKR